MNDPFTEMPILFHPFALRNFLESNIKLDEVMQNIRELSGSQVIITSGTSVAR